MPREKTRHFARDCNRTQPRILRCESTELVAVPNALGLRRCLTRSLRDSGRTLDSEIAEGRIIRNVSSARCTLRNGVPEC